MSWGRWSKGGAPPAPRHTYVGQTSRSFMQRVKEHRTALATGNCLTSAAAEHAMTTNHAINWDQATVINHHPTPHHNACWSLGTLFPSLSTQTESSAPYQMYTMPYSPTPTLDYSFPFPHPDLTTACIHHRSLINTVTVTILIFHLMRHHMSQAPYI